MNRIGISAAMLVLSTPFVSWGAECNGGGTPFGKYQTVTKGMLDLTMAGKMNHVTSNGHRRAGEDCRGPCRKR